MNATDSAVFSQESLLWIFRSGKHFFRHDVDYDLGCARKMAQFERDHHISSVYYLRSRADEYQVGSSEFIETVEVILKSGHLIGAHIDLGLPRDAPVSAMHLQDCVAEQVDELGINLGERPQISFHAPPQDALWRNVWGYDHAMSPRWAARYLADSRGVFRLNPREYLTGRGVWQVNLHPEWWFLSEEEAQAMREREAVKP